MTPEQFCYWLQGRAELQPDTAPTEAEWKMIREHLQTVFVKVTPKLSTGLSNPPWMPSTTFCTPNMPSGVPIAVC